MGFPPGSSSPPADITRGMSAEDIEWLRHSLLGNAFAVQSVRHVLSGAQHIFQDVESMQAPRDLTSIPASHDEVMRVVQDLQRRPVPLPSNEAR